MIHNCKHRCVATPVDIPTDLSLDMDITADTCVYIKFGECVMRVMGNYVEGLNCGITLNSEHRPHIKDGHLAFPFVKGHDLYLTCSPITCGESVYHLPEVTTLSKRSATVIGMTRTKPPCFPMTGDVCRECME